VGERLRQTEQLRCDLGSPIRVTALSRTSGRRGPWSVTGSPQRDWLRSVGGEWVGCSSRRSRAARRHTVSETHPARLEEGAGV
jgi:hypothetical protein